MTPHDRPAVFFDLDGTLLDTNYLHVLAWWKALAKAGQRRPMSEIHRLIGMGSSEFLVTLIGEDDEGLKEAHGTYFGELHPLITPLPGASELVEAVKEHGGVVVMVTSANRSEVPALLASLGAADLVDAVIDGEDADRAKPHPDLFSLALARVDRSPDAVVALGDSVWDVEAAKRAGIGCIGVSTGGISAQELLSVGALDVYRSCVELLAAWTTSPLGTLLGS
jgi:HAD superfamily hydrolase (TIGR01509 family)